jgi:hypothetical protein
MLLEPALPVDESAISTVLSGVVFFHENDHLEELV